MTQEPTPTEKFVERLTALVGSIPSLVVHSLAFAAAFLVAIFHFAAWDTVLLVMTTVVSLEAIYISILIQITVNRQARELHEVSEDVEDIQEDVEEISKDVEEISDDVDEISDDVEEIAEDVEEIAEDVEEMSDDWDLETGSARKVGAETLESLEAELRKITAKIEALKNLPKP